MVSWGRKEGGGEVEESGHCWVRLCSVGVIVRELELSWFCSDNHGRLTAL